MADALAAGSFASRRSLFWLAWILFNVTLTTSLDDRGQGQVMLDLGG